MLKMCQGYELMGKMGVDFCSPAVDNVSMSPGKKGHLLKGARSTGKALDDKGSRY